MQVKTKDGDQFEITDEEEFKEVVEFVGLDKENVLIITLIKQVEVVVKPTAAPFNIGLNTRNG